MEHTHFIILGAAGNLTKLKLVPALYRLAVSEKLPKSITIWGIARRNWSASDFANEMRKSFVELYPDEEIDTKIWDDFIAKNMQFIEGDLSDSAVFSNLNQMLAAKDQELQIQSEKIFYFALPPELYDTVLSGIKNSSLLATCQDTCNKLVLEKPFGHNYESAQQLQQKLLPIFSEKQIYRIDHVLAKDTLEDIVSFRTYNQIFDALLQQNTLDHIQISYLEKIGIEGRGKFYEKTGVIRDILQNHALQILAAAAMDTKKTPLSEARKDVIESLAEVTKDNIVVGQYEASNSEPIGYRDEKDVSSDSEVPTFAALKTEFTKGKLTGVPVYMRSGKHMKGKFTEVIFVFKHDRDIDGLRPNMLAFRIQPNEGVFLSLIKRDLMDHGKLENIELDFCYKQRGIMLHDGYENLLYYMFKGHKEFFISIDEILAGWKVFDNAITATENSEVPLHMYKKGTDGPAESDALLTKDNRRWYTDDFALVCRI